MNDKPDDRQLSVWCENCRYHKPGRKSDCPMWLHFKTGKGSLGIESLIEKSWPEMKNCKQYRSR